MKITQIVLCLFLFSINAFAAKVAFTSKADQVKLELTDIASAEVKELVAKYKIEVDDKALEELLFEKEFVTVTFTFYDFGIKTQNKEDPGTGRDHSDDRDRKDHCRVVINIKEQGSSTEVSVNGNARLVRGGAGVKHEKPSRELSVSVEGSASDCRSALSTFERIARDR